MLRAQEEPPRRPGPARRATRRRWTSSGCAAASWRRSGSASTPTRAAWQAATKRAPTPAGAARSALRVGGGDEREVERDPPGPGRPGDRDRRRADEPRGQLDARGPQGARRRARPRAARCSRPTPSSRSATAWTRRPRPASPPSSSPAARCATPRSIAAADEHGIAMVFTGHAAVQALMRRSAIVLAPGRRGLHLAAAAGHHLLHRRPHDGPRRLDARPRRRGASGSPTPPPSRRSGPVRRWLDARSRPSSATRPSRWRGPSAPAPVGAILESYAGAGRARLRLRPPRARPAPLLRRRRAPARAPVLRFVAAARAFAPRAAPLALEGHERRGAAPGPLRRLHRADRPSARSTAPSPRTAAIGGPSLRRHAGPHLPDRADQPRHGPGRRARPATRRTSSSRPTPSSRSAPTARRATSGSPSPTRWRTSWCAGSSPSTRS